MNSLEEIALKVAEETDAYCEHEMEQCVSRGDVFGDYREFRDKEFALRLVAALGAQEPVAVVTDDDTTYEASFLKAFIPAGTKLFAAPVLPSVPEGWQWVPKEPTPAMLDATASIALARLKHLGEFNKGIMHGLTENYKAMLAAAPSPQEDAP